MIDLPLPVLGSYFNYFDRSVAGGGGTGVNTIVGPNPQRWALYFWNPGQGAVTLRVHPLFVSTSVGGDDLTAGTTFRLFTFRDLGSVIHAGWGFEVNPLTLDIGCIEIVYQPPVPPILKNTGGPLV